MRRGQVAAFYTAHAAELQSALTHQLGDPHLAEEALATAWERLLRRPDIDLTQGAGWMYVVARNEALRLRQRAGRATSIDLPVGDTGTEAIVDLLASSDDPADRVAQYERLAELKQLSPVQREALLLAAAGLSYDEIATHTASSHTSVKKRLATARARLRTNDRIRQHREFRTRAAEPTDPDRRGLSQPESELEQRLERISARQHDEPPQLQLEIDR